MMASGNSLASAMRLALASGVSSSVSRSCSYWSQSVATASGNSLDCLRLANFAGDLEHAFLMHQPFNAGRQVERLPSLDSFDVFQLVP